MHATNLVKYANQFGADYIKTTMSHELIHSLTHALLARMSNDATGKTASYQNVEKDLSSTFFFDTTTKPDVTGEFSVRRLISEFAAEYFATKATGLQSFSVAYSLIRATGQKLLQRVGEGDFRKAVLTNDPAAYRRLVEAADVLQSQNRQANRRDAIDKDIAGMRAAQVAAPFGTPLNGAILDKLEERYIRKSDVHATLKKTYPDQAKQFDFRFMNAVDAHFKKRGKSYDGESGAAGQRELLAAIRAVWPALK